MFEYKSAAVGECAVSYESLFLGYGHMSGGHAEFERVRFYCIVLWFVRIMAERAAIVFGLHLQSLPSIHRESLCVLVEGPT